MPDESSPEPSLPKPAPPEPTLSDAASGLLVRPAAAEDIPAVRAFMLRIFEEDYGYGYQPQWHWDYDDLAGVYIEHPRQTLVLALDTASGEIVGTGAIRAGGPRSPEWLAARYQPPEATAQIVRVFVHREHRKRGVARLLVGELRRIVQAVGGYRTICLHTETVPDFWARLGFQLIHDGRTATPPDPSIHFELPMTSPPS